MADKGEGRAHPANIDQCSLVREEANYHRGAGLEAALDADDEYDPIVPSR